ncbi:MAG: M48 family metallopeptidase [Candidatus Omnitrophica bacterium]|nr:M48 family metallopeptidase [Candidatus Omnitrophota bacterium]
MQILNLEKIGPLVLERNKRVKRIVLTRKNPGETRVKVPARLSFEETKNILSRNTDWIMRFLSKVDRAEKAHSSLELLEITPVEASRRLISRSVVLADKFGFSFRKIYVKNLNRAWGTCSPRNNITLNRTLARLPDELLDYVILHELIHTRVKDHSAVFWDEFKKVLPDAKELNRKIKKYQLHLIRV